MLGNENKVIQICHAFYSFVGWHFKSYAIPTHEVCSSCRYIFISARISKSEKEIVPQITQLSLDMGYIRTIVWSHKTHSPISCYDSFGFLELVPTCKEIQWVCNNEEMFGTPWVCRLIKSGLIYIHIECLLSTGHRLRDSYPQRYCVVTPAITLTEMIDIDRLRHMIWLMTGTCLFFFFSEVQMFLFRFNKIAWFNELKILLI